MQVVEKRIHEAIKMEREDLMTRKAEAMYGYLEARFGKKKKRKGKGKGKGKKGKKK